MKKILTACLFALMVNSICAQQWMPVGGGVSGSSVRSIIADTINDLIVVAGNFDTAGSVFVGETASWDGVQWQPMPNPDVFHDQLYIYNGEYYHAGSQVLKWDGTDWNIVGDFFNGGIGALNEYNGQLVAGGPFTTVGATFVSGLAILDSNDEWQPFPGGGITGSGFVGIGAIEIYNDDLIVAGNFDYAGGVPCNNIARWDGSQWHPLGSGTAGSSDVVKSLGAYQGFLYVCGGFTTAGGVYCLGFGKWDGNQWYEVDNSMQFSADEFVVHSDELYAGGLRLNVNQQSIMKFNGLQWIPLVNNLSGHVYSIDILNNILYAGGSFHIYGTNDTIPDIAMLDLITSEWQPVSISEEIKVYPNPATDKVYLSASLTAAKVSIINSLGQLVLQTTAHPNEPIDVSALPAGFYSLLLTSQKKREAVSFIKQ